MSALNDFLGKIVTQIVNPLILLMSGVAFVVFAWGVFEFIRGSGRRAGRRLCGALSASSSSSVPTAS